MVCSWKSIDANHDTRQYCSSTRFRTEVDKMCKSASDRCMTRRCSCAAHSLKCTKFCSCGLGGVNCTRSNENNDTGMDENEDVLD